MKKYVALFLYLINSLFAFSQDYVLKNEEIVFQFKTKNNKIMSLCKDKTNKYMVYRFGTKEKLEFEYPQEKDKSSWDKFEYSFWFRGGGKENSGIDLNYLAFTNQNMKYVLFHTYAAEDKSYNLGVKVIDISTDNEVVIKGLKNSQKGTLVDFRFNNLVKEGDEIYD